MDRVFKSKVDWWYHLVLLIMIIIMLMKKANIDSEYVTISFIVCLTFYAYSQKQKIPVL